MLTQLFMCKIDFIAATQYSNNVYLSHCYTIAWDRIYDQSSLCMFLLALSLARSLCVCICSHYKSRNYERIFTKFGSGVDNLNGQGEIVSGENRKVVRCPFAHKTAQKRLEIGKSQPNIKSRISLKWCEIEQ